MAAAFQDYLHFPVPDPLYALVGAMAGTMMSGYPVWLMLVGPSSCGKTVLLESLLVLDKIKEIDSVTGEAAFLSGTKEKERAKGALGGLLKEMGDRGLMVLSDFTTILAKPDANKDEIMTALRKIYDGRFTRTVGTDGGKTLLWTGRVGLLAGCTDVIDRQSAENAEMGQRCIFWRYPQSQGWQEANKALQKQDPDKIMYGMQTAMLEFMTEAGLDWERPEPIREFTQTERNIIISIAQFVAASRSSVTRDRYRRELTDVQGTEYPTRLARELSVSWAGMERIGCTYDECLRVVRKIGFDCMTSKKRRALGAIREGYRNLAGIAKAALVSTSETRRTLEELVVHGLVERTEIEWMLSERALELLAVGWGES